MSIADIPFCCCLYSCFGDGLRFYFHFGDYWFHAFCVNLTQTTFKHPMGLRYQFLFVHVHCCMIDISNSGTHYTSDFFPSQLTHWLLGYVAVILKIESQFTMNLTVYSKACLGLHQRKYQSPMSSQYERIPPVTSGFPSQRASNTESISMVWCYHELQYIWFETIFSDSKDLTLIHVGSMSNQYQSEGLCYLGSGTQKNITTLLCNWVYKSVVRKPYISFVTETLSW